MNGYRNHVPDYKAIARIKRLKNPTLAEKILKVELRTLRPLGFRFRRERMVLGWCLDFYCPPRRLAVEVDGGYHLSRIAEDSRRDRVLSQKLSIRTIRFTNEQVIKNPAGVVYQILAVLRRRPVFASWNQGIKSAIPSRRNAAEPGARGHRTASREVKAVTGTIS